MTLEERVKQTFMKIHESDNILYPHEPEYIADSLGVLIALKVEMMWSQGSLKTLDDEYHTKLARDIFCAKRYFIVVHDVLPNKTGVSVELCVESPKIFVDEYKMRTILETSEDWFEETTNESLTLPKD